MDLIWILLLIFNILLYGACCFVIFRRKAFTCISIRSPILLILNIIGNLLMTIIIILTKSLEDNDKKKVCSFFYYISNFLIIIPFCLRFRRIIKCCEIKVDERLELQELYSKKYKFEEKYNIKIMSIIFFILTAVLILSNILITRSEAITAKFLYVPDDSKLEDANPIIWCIINFIEIIILLSYAYYIFINQLKQKLRFEILSFFCIWFIYSDIITVFDIISSIDNDIYIYISLATCYLFLIINAILPIIISYSYRHSTSYSFTPKLTNNLYLFLSNETCYNQFKIYLIQKNQNLLGLLKLYIGIMNYKLGYKLKINNEQCFVEAMDLRDEFFDANNIARLPENVFGIVKQECKSLDNNNFQESMFDEALKYCFTELGKIFNEFKKTEEFKELYKNLFLTTYIQCKMCNVGLINKF